VYDDDAVENERTVKEEQKKKCPRTDAAADIFYGTEALFFTKLFSICRHKKRRRKSVREIVIHAVISTVSSDRTKETARSSRAQRSVVGRPAFSLDGLSFRAGLSACRSSRATGRETVVTV